MQIPALQELEAALLEQCERDLPMLWSELADVDDMCVVLDEDRYWRGNIQDRLFLLLYQKRWDEALECVKSWTVEDVNPRKLPESSYAWSAQEELDNAVKVVTEYMNQHLEQD